MWEEEHRGERDITLSQIKLCFYFVKNDIFWFTGRHENIQKHIVVDAALCKYLVTIYIYAFSRRFYYNCIQVIHFHQYVWSLGIEPTTFCAADAMFYHWATQVTNTILYSTIPKTVYVMEKTIVMFCNVVK